MRRLRARRRSGRERELVREGERLRSGAGEDVGDGTRAGAAKFDHGEPLAVGGNLILGNDVHRPGSLLGFEDQIGFEPQNTSFVEGACAHRFGGIVGGVGAEVAVIDPPGLGDAVDRLAEIERHALVVVATAAVHMSSDGEITPLLRQSELTGSEWTEVGAALLDESPVT